MGWPSVHISIDSHFTFDSATNNYVRNNNLGEDAGPYLGERVGITISKALDNDFTQDAEAVIIVEDNAIVYNQNNSSEYPTAILLTTEWSSPTTDPSNMLMAFCKNNTIKNIGQYPIDEAIVLDYVSMGLSGTEPMFYNNIINGLATIGLLIYGGEGIIDSLNIANTDNINHETINIVYDHMNSNSEVNWFIKYSCFYIGYSINHIIAQCSSGHYPPSGEWVVDYGNEGTNYFEDNNGNPNMIGYGNIDIFATEAQTCSLD